MSENEIQKLIKEVKEQIEISERPSASNSSKLLDLVEKAYGETSIFGKLNQGFNIDIIPNPHLGERGKAFLIVHPDDMN